MTWNRPQKEQRPVASPASLSVPKVFTIGVLLLTAMVTMKVIWLKRHFVTLICVGCLLTSPTLSPESPLSSPPTWLKVVEVAKYFTFTVHFTWPISLLSFTFKAVSDGPFRSILSHSNQREGFLFVCFFVFLNSNLSYLNPSVAPLLGYCLQPWPWLPAL